MGSHEGRLKEKYLPSFHKAYLVDQMLDLRQSTSNVYDYVNSFEELTKSCDLLEDPSITIVRFIRALRTDLKREVILSMPYTLDEAYYKTLEVEKLDKLYPVRRAAPCSRTPAQSIPKMNEFSVSASTSKGHNPQIAPRVAPQGASSGTSRNPVQCFSCRGRGHYAFKCLHRTQALEHESFEPSELEEEVLDPQGDF